MNINVQEILAAAQAVQLPTNVKSCSSNSQLSFGIVNCDNGKRVKLSKGIVSAFGITENADILPIKSEGVIMIAKKLPYEIAPQARSVSLKNDKKGKSGEGGKIAYNSGMVALLTEVFSLDFTDRTSMAFDDIHLDELPDKTPMALVRIPVGSSKADVPTEKQVG